jgi:hypothetical protein
MNIIRKEKNRGVAQWYCTFLVCNRPWVLSPALTKKKEVLTVLKMQGQRASSADDILVGRVWR